MVNYIRKKSVEDDVLKGLVQWLRVVKPKCLWWHTANEGNFNVRHRASLKAKGILPGVPDLIFLGTPVHAVGLVELKSETGRLTPSQKYFRDFCTENKYHDIPYHVIKTNDLNTAITELEALLKSWGAL